MCVGGGEEEGEASHDRPTANVLFIKHSFCEISYLSPPSWFFAALIDVKRRR